jgi:hypothetical protein
MMFNISQQYTPPRPVTWTALLFFSFYINEDLSALAPTSFTGKQTYAVLYEREIMQVRTVYLQTQFSVERDIMVQLGEHRIKRQ